MYHEAAGTEPDTSVAGLILARNNPETCTAVDKPQLSWAVADNLPAVGTAVDAGTPGELSNGRGLAECPDLYGCQHDR